MSASPGFDSRPMHEYTALASNRSFVLFLASARLFLKAARDRWAVRSACPLKGGGRRELPFVVLVEAAVIEAEQVACCVLARMPSVVTGPGRPGKKDVAVFSCSRN
jgi:hypothetical protein